MSLAPQPSKALALLTCHLTATPKSDEQLRVAFTALPSSALRTLCESAPAAGMATTAAQRQTLQRLARLAGEVLANRVCVAS